MKSIPLYLLLAIAAAVPVANAQDSFRMRRGSSGGSSGSTEKPSEITPRAKPMVEPFNILLNTSIFARDRRTGNDRVVEPPPAAVNPETYFAFRGAAEENGQVIGFVEDTRDSSTLRVKEGDPLASGKVAKITLDKLEFQHGASNQPRSISLGCDLTGREVMVASSSSDSTSSSSSSSNTSANRPFASINDIANYRGGRFGNNGPNDFGGRRRDFGGNGFGGPGGGFGGPGGGQDFGGRRGRRDNGGGFGG